MIDAATETFIFNFQRELQQTLLNHPEIETVNHLEGLPGHLLKKILAPNPLSLFIPSDSGGRGGGPADCLALLEATAYESLAVGLMLGINGSLFLEPVAKYGQQQTQAHVFQTFLRGASLGGLMITEPDFGTDALSMQTAYKKEDQGYTITGKKHWGGLTGLANFWLVTARKEKQNGGLARDLDLFVVDQSQPEQTINVAEYYHKLGLFLIPYGLNSIDVKVPTSARLIAASSGVKLMMDLLHRSRMRLSGIGLGFIKRMLDEAVAHCQQRYVSGKNLLGYDQVQQRLAELQAAFTVNSAICHFAAGVSAVENDLVSYGLQANSIKAVVTDMMQEAAQSLLQLTGAKGYRRDHIAGRAVADSRPFQIFEGSNDVMYSQIADAVIKEMKKKKETNLHLFFSTFDLTAKIADRYHHLFNFQLDVTLAQRYKVALGKIVARLITLGFTVDLATTGFRSDLVENAMQVVGGRLTGLVSSVVSQVPAVQLVEGYLDGGDWKKSISPVY